MRIEYELLRARDGGPKIGTVRFDRGSIRLAIEAEEDREIVQRFFDDAGPLARNEKLDDGSTYWAAAGSRTWFQETVQQRLYYAAGYGYTVMEQSPVEGFMILRISEPSGHRRLSREHLDEWPVLFETESPGANNIAFRRLLVVWEGGLADQGIMERVDDAREIHSLLDRPDHWEIIHARPPSSQGLGSQWTRLGIDVAYWGGDFSSALDELGELDLGELNQHGLVDDQTHAEGIQHWYTTEVEPGHDLRLVEVWTAAQL